MIAPQRMQHFSSGGLALLVHGLLLLGLMVGVSWKNPPQLPIEADIWTDLPALPQPAPAQEYAPQPETLPTPEPITPAAEPDPAQIALEKEKAEQKRAERQRRKVEQEQAALQLALKKKQAEEEKAAALLKAEQERLEQARLEKERIEREKREQARRLIDQDLARQMREELNAESSQLDAMQTRSRIGGQSRMVRDFQERIRAKIRDALVLPQNLRGGAEVEFQVSLLPNGEVARVILISTSGQPLYDGAVERAIYKASPLPLPSNREAAKQFRDGLTLKFRPSDNAENIN